MFGTPSPRGRSAAYFLNARAPATPQPALPPPRWHETSVSQATSDFSYDDGNVRLRIGTKTYKVARSRLTQRSPVFRDMFNVTKEGSYPGLLDDVVELHDNVVEFEHYLWFIHADALDVAELNSRPDDPLYLERWISVAKIAHKYQVDAVADWSIGLVLQDIDDRVKAARSSAFDDQVKSRRTDLPFDIRTMARFLLSVTALWASDTPQAKCARALFRAVLYRRAHHSAAWGPNDIPDIIPILEEHNETQFLARAYYYILAYRGDSWMSDARLSAVDRQRLLCGFHGLSRAGVTIGGTMDGYDLGRIEDVAVEQHGPQLWTYFDASALRLENV
ncbi:hypothetical protein EXIGLDRAFT_768989 [Exidia glandulosa HHB12029]|uniref:BTB domain-containing protein n=1 Tax=Exidia glandulosa HHB12029 TaxID=1314781 RepID=A0A166AJB8_EXIGL|nr:hypothetical protein EXIGLDRAFT_768989 [Exidia glandulosa HHB12029]